MVKALLFDFDGTIVLSEKSRLWSLNKVLREFGVEISENEWSSKYKRMNSHDVLLDIKKKQNLDYDVEEIYNKAASFRSNYIDENGLMVAEGFFDFYENIKEKGIPHMICSGGTREHLNKCIKAVNLPEIEFVSREDYSNEKPFPDCYLEGLKRLGVNSSEVVVIDDTYYGMLAGIRAGCRVVGINCRDEGDVDTLPVNTVIDDFKDFDDELLWKLGFR